MDHNAYSSTTGSELGSSHVGVALTEGLVGCGDSSWTNLGNLPGYNAFAPILDGGKSRHTTWETGHHGAFSGPSASVDPTAWDLDRAAHHRDIASAFTSLPWTGVDPSPLVQPIIQDYISDQDSAPYGLLEPPYAQGQHIYAQEMPPRTSGFVGSVPQLGTSQTRAADAYAYAPEQRVVQAQPGRVKRSLPTEGMTSISGKQDMRGPTNPSGSGDFQPMRTYGSGRPSASWEQWQEPHRAHPLMPASSSEESYMLNRPTCLPYSKFSTALGRSFEEVNALPDSAQLHQRFTWSSAGQVLSSHPDDMIQTTSVPKPISSTLVNADADNGHRTHPYYSARAQQDGYYHCPFEGQSTCNHRPTKLKCSYESVETYSNEKSELTCISKYIDSHVKPFRCRSNTCTNIEFSSTACLLRHEREAHGLHGHGNRPYVCEYADCERSIPGNGFPRHYNLLDHMKRVHSLEKESRPANSGPLHAQGKSSARTRGRRTSAKDVTLGASRTKASAGPSMPRRQDLRPMVSDRERRRGLQRGSTALYEQ